MRHLPATHISPKGINGCLTDKTHWGTWRTVSIHDHHFRVIGVKLRKSVRLAVFERMPKPWKRERRSISIRNHDVPPFGMPTHFTENDEVRHHRQIRSGDSGTGVGDDLISIT